MAYQSQETLAGIRSLITENQNNKDETLLTLYYFADESEIVLKEGNVKFLDPNSIKYSVGGSTALIDAVVRAIDEVGASLAARPESERPDKVVFVILTDGQENASKKFKIEDLKKRISEQSQTYNWQFMFLGANIDAFGAGAGYGIMTNNTANVAASKLGQSLIMSAKKVASYSCTSNSRSLSYSEQDRKDLA